MTSRADKAAANELPINKRCDAVNQWKCNAVTVNIGTRRSTCDKQRSQGSRRHHSIQLNCIQFSVTCWLVGLTPPVIRSRQVDLGDLYHVFSPTPHSPNEWDQINRPNVNYWVQLHWSSVDLCDPMPRGVQFTQRIGLQPSRPLIDPWKWVKFNGFK